MGAQTGWIIIDTLGNSFYSAFQKESIFDLNRSNRGDTIASVRAQHTIIYSNY